MRRESAAKRSFSELESASNGGGQQGTLSTHQGSKNQEISYRVDWEAEWPQVGNPNEQCNRLRIEGDKEWKIWRSDDKKRAHGEV